MMSPTLFVMVNPNDQRSAIGYDTWKLETLLQYNEDALAAGTVPIWIPIATVANATESRRFIEARLHALRG